MQNPIEKLEFGDIIKANILRLLKEKLWTKADLEKKANIGRVLHNIFHRENPNPTINTIYAIAKALEVSIEELLNDSLVGSSEDIKLFTQHVNAVEAILNSQQQIIPIELDLFVSICKEVYRQTKFNQKEVLEKTQIKKIIDFYLQKSS